MKKLLVVVMAVLMISSFSFAQKWVYDSDFSIGDRPHGVVVDDQDRVWIGYYGPADTMITAGGDTIAIDGLRCLKPDGTHESFSPIMIFTNGSDINDTLDWSYSFSCRGVALAADGNILFCGSAGKIYKINKLTGEAMAKIVTPCEKSPTKCAVDANGYIYVTSVVPGGTPIYIFDEDMELYSYVADSNFAISRAIEVSADGNDFYLGVIYGGGNEGIIHYKSDDGSGPDGTYTPVDTVWKSIWAGSSLDWDNNGLLWVGSYYDGNKGWKAWYAMDTTQNMVIVDTVGHCAGDTWETGVPAGGTYWSPRGAAWSADGKTMYTTDYDGGVIKKWTNAAPVGPGSPEITAGIDYEGETPVIVVNFTLSQNYPNPFNPTTMIPFDIENGNHVKLIVYDMLGHEVKTLVDDNLNPGHHEYRFDATGFATGMYIYRLEVNGQMLAKRMLYIK